MKAWIVLAAAGLAGGLDASATVYKCRATDGSISYQQMPCAEKDEARVAEIPSEFPPPNGVERERLLAREQELHRRLEAERDRLSAEAIARIMRPEPVVVAPPEPVYAVAWFPRQSPPRALRRPITPGVAGRR